ncbi:hypothetical protein B0T26DRAFT_748425 [Lasiosphaeria miniovina]|uniref:FAD-binding FR-type domain-containing protein n=1 Tax=Lasiosphaeria miniovina TaxID=1954250 RepID=A0AA40B601_9PEZI|nr:uncharacterized protein B0T26DRAFT_748425 [Lasiosphaeria miniovina]KAK0728162.1 hypothetical protein B0T26DRAFT_748425 [Lasiosphaeria miniovina]
MSKEGHLERTANEPRDLFLPGQWLDVYVPTVAKPGGFTITSAPSSAAAARRPGYLELAIQQSPDNAPAAWLWQQPADKILGSELRVRVGGSFVWPPAPPFEPRRAVFVAGGVGINPLMSILSALAESSRRRADVEVCVLYSVKMPSPTLTGAISADGILFLDRIAALLGSTAQQPPPLRGALELYLTGGGGAEQTAAPGNGRQEVLACNGIDVPFSRRRITVQDIESALGHDKESAVVYICGVPVMTDEFVRGLYSLGGLGLKTHQVLFEKWW